MRTIPRIFLLVIGLASTLGTADSRAGSLVEFPNLSDRTPAKLLGYLARPDTGLSGLLANRADRAGPYPAVVVLHGCGGISSHSAQIADKLGSWGYAALTVASLGPRGIASRCGGGGSLDQAFDAYAARRYLSQLDFVDPAHVAVLGQSMGGLAVLNVGDRDLAAQYFNERFRAAIAFYPGCGIPAASMTAPTLILIGEADETSPMERCREMVAHARPDGALIALTVYPGAYHAFDVAQLTPGIRFRGLWNLGGISADEPAEK
jgi:dienelactone hydrolase